MRTSAGVIIWMLIVISAFSETHTFTSPDFILHLGRNDSTTWFGQEIIFGQFNNDNYDDLVVLAPMFHNSNGDRVGKLYLYYGTKSGIDSTNVVEFEGRLPIHQGDSGGWMWRGLCSNCVGDINNDGYDDLVVGTPWYESHSDSWIGRGYLIILWSKADGSGLDLVNYQIVKGYSKGEGFAWTLYSADVNGDKCDDLIVSAGKANNKGNIYIYNGGDNFNTGVDAALTTDESYTIAIGIADVNGDGIFDIVGRTDEEYTKMAKVYIWQGGPELYQYPSFMRSIPYKNPAYITRYGDFNNDGFDDILFHDANYHENPNPSADINIIKGSKSFNIYNEVVIDFDFALAYANHSYDVNNDDLDDLFISADDKAFIFSGKKDLYINSSDTLYKFVDFNPSYGLHIQDIYTADMNGDGKIEFYGESDMEPWGKVVVQFAGTEKSQNTTLSPYSTQRSYFTGQEFWIDIQVGSESLPVTDLFGIAFKLDYETTYLDVVDMKAGPFLGSNLVPFFDDSPDEGCVSIGLSRKAGSGGVSGEGVIASVKFKVLQNITASTAVQFCTSNIEANASDGSAILLEPGCTSVILEDCLQVWPGDSNNDGIVNEKDVLPLGLHWHQTGPECKCRQQNTFTWAPCCCPPWEPIKVTYVDNNGDGLVDEKDILPIGFHFNQTHPTSQASFKQVESTSKISENSTSLSLVQSSTSSEQFLPGDTCRIDVIVEDVENLFGISYKLHFKNEEAVQIINAKAGEFLGSNILFMPNIDYENCIVSVGETRTDQPNSSSGTGVIGEVYFKLKENLVIGDTLTISLYDITANDAEGNAINITGISDRLTVNVAENTATMPESFQLHQNHPNPFNPTTTIHYELPRPCEVTFVILNSLGQVIRHMENRKIEAGIHSATWDGLNDNKQPVSSGVYFYRIIAEDFAQTRKMLLVR